ncbi:hypothetical protein HA50_17000 [Pantoea cypripedii]|uniref:Carrier domain-containing protein n=2 Tax=Pantoea cypripedii TaxID=55209 RepID=A0A1X1EY95_PANCY|nr:hypothetical protein HA50_17000 [Pantoea cypripedii]
MQVSQRDNHPQGINAMESENELAAGLQILTSSSQLFARQGRFFPDATTHGVSLRLDGYCYDDILGRLVREIEKYNNTIIFSLWEEPSQCEFTAEQARDFRAREIARPIDATQHDGRVIITRYPQDIIGVIITAHREYIDSYELLRLASIVQFDDATAKDGLATYLFDDARTPEKSLFEWGGAENRYSTPYTHFPLAKIKVPPDYYRDVIHKAIYTLLKGCGEENVAFAALNIDPLGNETLACITGDSQEQDRCIVNASALAVRDEPIDIGLILSEVLDFEAYKAISAPPFNLTFMLHYDGLGHVSGEVVCRAEKISAATAEDLAHQLEFIIAGLNQLGVYCRWQDVPLLTDAQQQQMLALGQGSALSGVTGLCIDQLFDVMASRYPGAIAVSDEKTQLTYAELKAQSEHLAAGLQKVGVKPGALVGICMERSHALVCSLLAVLKAGGTYVPMDTSYPADRLEFITRDAGVAVVVSDIAAFPPTEGCRVYSPGQLLSLVDRENFIPSRHDNREDAYVIYTSGTTGRPKGVAIPHRNVQVLLEATRNEFGLGNGDVWTLFHSCAFDFSVWEIWGCLLSGGHLVVVPYWTTRDTAEFYALLADKKVTVLNQTPSAFYSLQRIDADQRLTLSLRLIIFGGEKLNMQALEGWFHDHPPASCTLVNMYGITETTVHVTYEYLTVEHVLSKSASVGRALPGWTISVRNSEGHLQPFGVAGEIWVGGQALASHYLRLPELTVKRFITDALTGQRVYRSGDLGRMRPDGKLEHLGRLDSQVKVRGFRIELDEIRNVLQQCEGVDSAVVLLDSGSTQEEIRIGAWLIAHGALNLHTLRGALSRQLPDYMIPAYFTLVESFPLTSNGKIDVNALRKHAVADLSAAVASVEPSTGDVGALQAIWRQILGEAAHPDVDFFESGGNSLSAVRFIGEIRKQGLGQLSLRDFYMNASLPALEAMLNKPEKQ